jgi:hypothetical protein
MARPVFLFLLVLVVFIALAFVLDNMRGGDPRPEGWVAALGTLFRRPSFGATWVPGRLGGTGSPAGSASSRPASATEEASVQTARRRRSAKSSKGGEFRSGESVDPGRSLSDDPPAKRRSA